MISLAFAFFFSISSPPWVYYSIKAATPQGVSDILCFAQSDIMPYGIVIFLLPQKWYYIRLLTARRAISLRRSLNITAKQYNSPKANITKKLLFFRTRVFLAPQVGLEPTTLRLTAACSTNWAIEEYLCWHFPIFPGRRQPSIFGADELNFRVRDGNGWTLIAIDTN